MAHLLGVQSKSELELRWAVEAALQHKAVLPDARPDLVQAVNDLCEEMAASLVPGEMQVVHRTTTAHHCCCSAAPHTAA